MKSKPFKMLLAFICASGLLGLSSVADAHYRYGSGCCYKTYNYGCCYKRPTCYRPVVKCCHTCYRPVTRCCYYRTSCCGYGGGYGGGFGRVFMPWTW